MDFTKADSILSHAIGTVTPAAQLVIRHNGAVVHDVAMGFLDPETQTRPINAETLFDLASVTKLFTTTAFMTLIEEGKISVDDLVCNVLPEFSGVRPIQPYENPLDWGTTVSVTDQSGTVDASKITFRNLLAHNSGLPAWRAFKDQPDAEAAIRMALGTFFSYPIGERVVYSDVGLILLGLVVSRLVGSPLDENIYQRVTKPLGLSAHFRPAAPLQSPQNIAPTEFCKWRGRRIVGEVHDESAWRLGGVAGHAGMFAHARDVAEFGQSFLEASLLRRATIAQMTCLQAEFNNIRRGLGFALWSPDPEASSNPFSPATFGHTGFTGTCLWIDPSAGASGGFVTNDVYGGRENRGIADLRVQVHRAIVESVDADVIVIGLMSGTSVDGVDAAVVRLDGSSPSLQWEVLAHSHRAFDPQLRTEIFACFRPETGSVDRLCRLNFALGRAFGAAALEAAHEANLSITDVDLIGSHGQTLWHDPPINGEQGSTLQLGEPAVIAEMTSIPVVSNFRTRDMAAGGQGAPLVPLADRLLLSHPSKIRAVQNIGGIANVTFLPSISLTETRRTLTSDGVMAFDTGPGNMLIDEAARLATNGAWNYDNDGKLALQGTVDEKLLGEWLAEPFFQQTPPRSTGRELFGTQRAAKYWSQASQHGLGPNDIVATLTALTVHSIEYAYRNFLPAFPDEVIVSGGGARNRTLMAMLAERLSPARMTITDEYGLGIEVKEAVAFAVLAYETWHKRPGNVPAATGASRAVVLGSITY